MTLNISLSDLAQKLDPLGYVIISKDKLRALSADFYLHKYSSYEEYRDTQIHYNKLKIDKIWADESTLSLVANRIRTEFPNECTLKGLCHGTRNGFEQNYLIEQLKAEILGTDISETATSFPNSIQWDFHDVNPEWIEKNDFVYSNSLDQSWKPQAALRTWLGQLKKGGLLILEHTDVGHSPAAAGKMDPFGAKPQYMPYLLDGWFGHQISVEIIKSKKTNWVGKNFHVWLFVIKKITNHLRARADQGAGEGEQGTA